MPLAVDLKLSAFLGRRWFGTPDDAFVVLFFFDAASYADRKNPAGVLAAFERLAARRPDARLHCVIKFRGAPGTEPERRALEDRLAALGGRVQAINAFETDRLNDYQTKVQPVWEVLSSIDEGTIATYAGDVFVLAGDRNADRLWRVESTLKLGRLEYLAGRRGDQLAARRVLREMSQDSTDDPAVKIAAEQARSLTIEQYRNLR